MYWKRRANYAEGDENSASVKLEAYLHELSALQLQVAVSEGKMKEQTAAYRALQKEYCTLLDEQTQARNRGISPLPKRKDPPPAPSQDPSIAENIRNANAEIAAALQQKLERMEQDRNNLLSALSSIVSPDSIQGRGRKHTLEMELRLLDSSLSLLAQKLARYKKTVT